jgi:hypothetical protein
MRAKLPITIIAITFVVALLLLFRFRESLGNGKVSSRSTPQAQPPTNLAEVPANKPETLQEVVNDYHSTNYHASFKSAVTHELLAEQLKTNNAFLEWATNVAVTTIAQLVTNGEVPIYGTVNFSADALQFDKVTVTGWSGLYARAVYDPTPTQEGPLEFIVEGGVYPQITRIQNSYRMEKYQIDKSLWTHSPRNLGRMDWSGAVSPLDKSIVNLMLQQAFHDLTGRDLASLHLAPEMTMPKILNTAASHRSEKVAGQNSHARLYSSKDYVYPFAIFSTGYNNPAYVSFEGEIVQTSPGQGKFVSLSVMQRNTEAVYDLGEKFLGHAGWDQDMLDQVNSMSDEQRGQVYKRIFAHQ